MQRKIANLEIKIFYDSAITKKKVRELSKPQHARRVHRTLQTAGRGPGSGTQRTRQGNHHPPPAAAPGVQAASSQHHSAPADQQQLSRMVSEQDQHLPRQGRSAPSGRPCLLCREQVCRLGLARGQPACSHHHARGPPRSPPLHLPPTGAGSTLSWGSRGDNIHADARQAAVPPVPTRGLPTAASWEQAEALVPPTGSSHLQTDLGPTLLPARSSLLTLRLPPAEFLIREFCSPQGADHQQHNPVSPTVLSLSSFDKTASPSIPHSRTTSPHP